MKKIKVGIVGGTGYTGVELLRLLSLHPQVDVICITSRAEAGHSVCSIYPSLRGAIDLEFSDPDSAPLDQCEVVFCATPNGVAMKMAHQLLNAGVKVIDLSADFRIKDIAVWEHWYGMTHSCPELVADAVYGLPERFRDDIKRAQLVANPGCYPTSVQLGFFPLLNAGIVDLQTLIADAKSGVSGAGRKAALGSAFSETADSFKAYSAGGHRHLPEIKQGLEREVNGPVDLVFTPHLLPMIRGIHATLYAKLTVEDIDLQQLFEDHYKDEPFVDVMPSGSHPDTRSVRGSNCCRLAVHRPQNGNTVVVLAVEDNLVKGAAGQAVQNMNLMFDLDETLGLTHIALVP